MVCLAWFVEHHDYWIHPDIESTFRMVNRVVAKDLKCYDFAQREKVVLRLSNEEE
jgi:hypothetical protein